MVDPNCISKTANHSRAFRSTCVGSMIRSSRGAGQIFTPRSRSLPQPHRLLSSIISRAEIWPPIQRITKTICKAAARSPIPAKPLLEGSITLLVNAMEILHGRRKNCQDAQD